MPEIIYRKLKDLKLLEGNPRQIGKPEFAILCQSIEANPDYFEARPLILSDRTGDLVILAGNMRYRAAKHLKQKEVPTILLSGLTEQREREIIIRDNVNNGAWDYDLIANEWCDEPLADWGLDVPGFEAVEEVGEADAEPQIDKAAELNKKWKVKSCDLWQIGEHRLLCGDSTKREDVERLMDGQKAQMVFTDPPYGMNLDTDYSKIGNDEHKPGRKHEAIENDGEQFDPTPIFEHFGYCDDVVLFGADYYSEFIPNKNDGSWLVWDKRVEERFDSIIGSAFELVWSKRKVKREIIRFEYVSWANRLADNVGGTKAHPTMKPLGMIQPLMAKFDGTQVADPFAGSGTTLVACQNLNRKCYAIEISENYCAVILERMATAFPEIEIKRIDG